MVEISNFNKAWEKPVVLVSPLDWGLGHTTRCIPIIQELLNRGCTVIIACNSVQRTLLIEEFPYCTYVHLQGYELQYGTSKWRTIGNLLLQLPKILIKINKENRWLNIYQQQQRIDAVISDNRFGLYSAGVPSVFITHQLHIKTALGWLANRVVQWLNYRQITHFSTCWIPDYKGARAIAGELSNPAQVPDIPVQYIGGLSRLQACTGTTGQGRILVILSGPEPQRTLFENLLLRDLEQHPLPAVLVRGLPETASEINVGPHISVYNHAPASLLNKLLCEADLVISRSGYTTVMDLLKLGKKSILVPTPGQAEQEYLARHLHRQQLAFTVTQTGFSLQKALAGARQFHYKTWPLNMEAYKTVVEDFLRTIG